MSDVKPITAMFLWFLIIFLGFGTLYHFHQNSLEETTEEQLLLMGSKTNSPPSLRMYYSIEKYSEEFNIPKHIAYNVAYSETRYCGPFHWNYNPYLVSYAGAVGPMQIITKYAHGFAGKKVTDKELMTDIEMNVMVSMKMLRKWYSIYHNWPLACGGYNTGSPIVNSYASFCSSNKNYKQNWINP
jgi:soluble lytic murein transglycosylase-like protein